MRQFTEKRITVGFDRPAKQVVDEIEQVTARMIRDGWTIDETVIDDSMDFVDLFFYRDITPDGIGE